MLVPVWVAGLWWLTGDPALRMYRAFVVAYVVLAVVFMLTGGKPYYLAGLFPILLAAGAEPVLSWAGRGAKAVRRSLLAAALALSAVVAAVLMLPLVPVDELGGTPILDINYDAGETVGWPAFALIVSTVYSDLPAEERATAVVVTRNYGEAGAVDRYRGGLDLPPAYSGHNSYAEWGPPSESAGTTIVVGYDQSALQRWFGSVEFATRIDNGVEVDNDEQGRPVWICRDRRAPWSELWPQVRRLG